MMREDDVPKDTSPQVSHALRHYRIWADTPGTPLNAPPWTRSGHIHDMVTHGKEHRRGLRLREEVSKIVDRRNKRTADHMVLDELAHVEMASVDMFERRVMFWIVGHSDCGLVVHRELNRV